MVTFDLLRTLGRVRVFGKSPLGAWVRVNEAVWPRLSALGDLGAVQSYGRFVHTLVLAEADRHMFFGTFFFRNRPELALLCALARRRHAAGRPVRIAVLGCSNGAEVYSIAAALRASAPGLPIVLHGVDISADAVAVARAGVYTRGRSDFVQEAICERMTEAEMAALFETDGELLRVRPDLRSEVAWHVGDATDPRLAARLGPLDIVVANRFLCHLQPGEAERSLRALARLVDASGYLFVSGVDLDVRTRVARELGWTPVTERLEEVHEGDPSLRDGWPLKYWGLEPLDRSRPDFALRYAAAFQVG
jgi:chemotaxis methyl-accepting protein methylase